MGKTGQNTNGIPQSVDTPTQTSMPTIKYQNDDQKPSNSCIKFLISLLIYVICILSLSISLYLSYRHQQLEYNVKSLMYLDNKVMRIESDLNDLIQKTNRLYTASSTTTTTINQNVDEMVRRDSIIGDNVELDATSNNNDDSIAVNKLPVHVYSDITRLKRDISNLKMARRQRQTAAHQSPNENCLCPPGES
jgi:hypothetical protein